MFIKWRKSSFYPCWLSWTFVIFLFKELIFVKEKYIDHINVWFLLVKAT